MKNKLSKSNKIINTNIIIKMISFVLAFTILLIIPTGAIGMPDVYNEFFPGEVEVFMKNPTENDFFTDNFPELGIIEIVDINQSLRDYIRKMEADYNVPDPRSEAELDEKYPTKIHFKLTLECKFDSTVINAVDIINRHPDVEYAQPVSIEFPAVARYKIILPHDGKR